MSNALLLLTGLWAASYVLHLAFYFGLGTIISHINSRNPSRRIQPNRRGDAQMRKDTIQSVKTMLVNSGCVAGGIFFQMQGWTLWPAAGMSWIGMLAMLAISTVLYDAWFYWSHRLMHTRALYKHHFPHHRSIAPTVWSNYSDTPIDAFASHSYYLIVPLLLPMHPLVLIVHRAWDHINGQIGHSGFEYFAHWTARTPWPMVCVTFHDQHHEHFHYNYANFFSFWDRLCGTLHPGYDAKVAAWEAQGSVKEMTTKDAGA